MRNLCGGMASRYSVGTRTNLRDFMLLKCLCVFLFHNGKRSLLWSEASSLGGPLLHKYVVIEYWGPVNMHMSNGSNGYCPGDPVPKSTWYVLPATELLCSQPKDSEKNCPSCWRIELMLRSWEPPRCVGCALLGIGMEVLQGIENWVLQAEKTGMSCVPDAMLFLNWRLGLQVLRRGDILLKYSSL